MVELVKHWNGWGPGQRFPLMTRPVAKVLVDSGFAVYVTADAVPENNAAVGSRDTSGHGAANAERRKEAGRAGRKRHQSR